MHGCPHWQTSASQDTPHAVMQSGLPTAKAQLMVLYRDSTYLLYSAWHRPKVAATHIESENCKHARMRNKCVGHPQTKQHHCPAPALLLVALPYDMREGLWAHNTFRRAMWYMALDLRRRATACTAHGLGGPLPFCRDPGWRALRRDSAPPQAGLGAPRVIGVNLPPAMLLIISTPSTTCSTPLALPCKQLSMPSRTNMVRYPPRPQPAACADIKESAFIWSVTSPS